MCKCGASDSDIADIITGADIFLAMYDYTDWKSLSDDDTESVKYWHGMLDDYNNGIIGPGHCDEFGDELNIDGGFGIIDGLYISLVIEVV